MRHVKRRRWDRFWLVLAAVVAGTAASVGALIGDQERIGNYWMHAALSNAGSAQVVEVIDYDFGIEQRHGILRDIPDVDPAAEITVSSPTAPDDLRVSGTLDGVHLRVGNPDVTVNNRHRYRIEYPIDTLTQGNRVAWNAIGFDWDVDIDNAEIHVTIPNELSELECDRGRSGAQGGCTTTQVGPGHIIAKVSDISAGDAVTIYATIGPPLGQPPAPPAEPTGPAPDPGTGWLVPGLVGLGAAIVGAAGVSAWVRRMGREQVWEGGAADAAFGPRQGETVGVRLLDYDELASMATIEFESPRGLSAAAGGIVHTESVRTEHQIAWLIECAIRDEVILDQDGEDLTLRRGPATPHPTVAPRLDDIFGGRDRVELGKYDKEFATAWNGLGVELEEWRKASGLWDPQGRQRKLRFRVGGIVVGLAGLALAGLGGALANASGSVWLILAGLGGLVAGAGAAAVIRSWELPIRSPEGSARWLQVESFRRFIANSEARHAESAARMGLLRHYTAWAVALDELDHWEDAVSDAAADPGSSVSAAGNDFRFVALAPTLSRATAQTFTAPSSSGGGGGGGGGAGGGGGGGGGGSW